MDNATAFLYSGANPIQTGVAPNTITATRAAVIRGKVLDQTKAALPGVTITILNHPEFGQTLSRADGMFDLAINGGGPLTINYAKAGRLPAQRQIQVPWQEYVMAPDVILIPQDTQVTTIQLTGLASMQLGGPGRPTLVVNNTQVARGSVVTDSDGSRQATLIFQAGTQAALVMPDGSKQPVSTLHVRATEYTVGPNGPSAMPAGLPPTSAYTYAVDLSADEVAAAGASSVTFDHPIIVYAENFLRFPVGQSVPEGYYDRVRGVWVPSDSGLVLKVLNIDGGLASLDVDGSGQPASAAALSSLGITDSERAQLGSLYSAGQSLWRVPVTHFSSWDSNWGWGPPPDAIGPNGGSGSEPDPKPDDPCKTQGGSIVECQSQVLGESISLAGTPFSLTYNSDRVTGRKAAFTLSIPLSGASVPASLKRIDLDVAIAGRLFRQSFPPTANQTATFTWDGKDAYGRIMQGAQPGVLLIGFVYDGVYQATSKFGYSCNNCAIGGNRTRMEITFQVDRTFRLGTFVALPEGFGGWNLSVHHAYDPFARILYLGDGTRRSAESVGTAVLTTAAGNGQRRPFGTPNGDGGPALQAYVTAPLGVAMAADGSLYIAEEGGIIEGGTDIRRVDPKGVITTVAGNGQRGFSGDGGPATQASVNPARIALGPDGSIYFSDPFTDANSGRVRRVDANGIITTVAGGTCCSFGDGGPATQARLARPEGIAVGADGSLYIADSNLVRRVDPSGVIKTVAGVGLPAGPGGANGDGGPATQAFVDPWDVAVAPDGSLYIADLSNHRVRKVSPSGTITTVAGNGIPGFSGDGGPAVSASLNFPQSITLGRDGGLYIADWENNRVRLVDLSGRITTVAGNGTSGPLGDGGPATQAGFTPGDQITTGPDGSLYIANSIYNRVRRVASDLPGVTPGDLLIASSDGSEVYHFELSGKHLRTYNALTGAVRYQFSYNSNGHLSQITDGDSNVTTIAHDASANPIAIVAPFGQRTSLTVDANGYLASVIDPAGGTFSMSYTPDGLLTQFTDPNGHSSSMTYEAFGRLSRDADAAGGSTRLTRTDAVQSYTVSLSTALNRTTIYQIQNLSTGDELRVNTSPDATQTQLHIGTDGSRNTTFADGTILSLLQGPDPRFGMQTPLAKSLNTTTGGLTSTISTERTATLADPLNPLSLAASKDTLTVNSRTLTSSFDAASMTFTNTSPAGRVSTTTIDAQGRVIHTQASGLLAANFSYDSHGRLAAINQGMGSDARTTTFSYNSQGYLQAATDPVGRRSGFQYDPNGRVIRSTLPDGSNTDYRYDANGNLTALMPAGRPAHTFTYNAVNQISHYTPPPVAGTGTTLYIYDADHQLANVTRPDAKTIGFAYDSAGRLSARTIARGTYTYTYYSTTGNLSTITAPDGGKLTYGYNGSLFTNITWTGVVTGTVGQTYNNDFRTASSSVNGDEVKFSYDADSLLTQAGGLTLIRDPQRGGIITGTGIGNVNEVLSYNAFGELTGINDGYGGTIFWSEQYSRDQLGRITQKVTASGARTTVFNYTYDLAGRLSQVQQNGVTTLFTYDNNGNRTGSNRGEVTTSAAYDDQDRLTQYGGTTYSYTPNGELQTKTDGGTTSRYIYDELGNLVSVTLPDGTLIEYIIDGQNRRIGKKIQGSLVKGFLYGNQLNLVAELDGSNHVLSRFVYGSRGNVPDYMIKNGSTYRIVTDQLGSPRLLVDVTTGAIAQRLDYDEFGNVILDTSPGFQPFGFAGGLYDQDTSLIRFGARDYDASTGRWTTGDPSRLTGGPNFYQYSFSDPVNYIDVKGKNPLLLVAVFILLMGNAAPSDTAEAPTDLIAAGTAITGLGGLSIVADTTVVAALGPEAAESGAYTAIGSTSKVGEEWLAQNLGGESQVYFSTSQGGRYVDQLVNGLANESKVGYVCRTAKITKQIAKDVELLNSGDVNGVTWHFFESPVTGLKGPSAPLVKLLQDNGINVIIH
jgi:RHS repeat-associated protein